MGLPLPCPAKGPSLDWMNLGVSSGAENAREMCSRCHMISWDTKTSEKYTKLTYLLTYWLIDWLTHSFIHSFIEDSYWVRNNSPKASLLLMLQMTIGNAPYQCSCVRYASNEIILIVAVPIAVALLIFIVAIITVIGVHCRRQREPSGKELSSDNDDGFNKEDIGLHDYSRRLPDEYK